MNTRHLLVLPLTLLCIIVNAQASLENYQSFALEHKSWEIQVGLIMENLYGNYIDGDTLINDEKWKKVYNYYGLRDLGLSYYAAVREVGKKVYAIAKGSNRPRLLYDFGMKVGARVRCGVEGNAFGCLLDNDEQPDTLLGFEFVSTLQVERIDTVVECGLKHRRFYLTFFDAYNEPLMKENGEDCEVSNVVWVEGVGASAGPFSPWLPVPSFGNYTFLTCLMGNVCIFGSTGFYDADVITDVIRSRSIINKSRGLHDIVGRRVTNPQHDGLYIRDGRKYVVK